MAYKSSDASDNIYKTIKSRRQLRKLKGRRNTNQINARLIFPRQNTNNFLIDDFFNGTNQVTSTVNNGNELYSAVNLTRTTFQQQTINNFDQFNVNGLLDTIITLPLQTESSSFDFFNGYY
ncbi:uncharacterized protein OCT59_025159 [Rhizophagus irregularis]|uniref:Uncharacterized protein n=2 Tax=Rhizophagus irregularis TaxID=588596 RepID=A0A916E7P9_9GLOM|nr:hypothetical protein OCT59_025159 [Rhizophagus irregularis]CAB4490279.1 unnamed protein product [Rhizophagus irregularis]CAB5360842.1 unnamed protein product [Rhizophagus irregularis]